jgi:hypothetical protein
MENNSYLNFIVFIITTILYFLIKPDPYTKTEDGEESPSPGSSYMMTGAYFLVVIISQFFINSYLITTSCGGNVMSNLKESALYTFVPWTLIFGVVMIALVAYPDIKGAFSDVYGYYFVSGSAQRILTELLKGNIDSSVTSNPSSLNPSSLNPSSLNPSAPNNPIDTSLNPSAPPLNPIDTSLNPSAPPLNPIDTSLNPSAPPLNPIAIPTATATPIDKEKGDMLGGGGKIYKGGASSNNDQVSDLVLKIYGNMSILINQLTPSNFNYYWDNMLTPLFKDEYKVDKTLAETKKTDLLKLVVQRDNIGEGMWYIYTGILICSLVQFKLSSVGCKSNQEILAANYKKLREEQKQKTVTSTATA